MLWKVDTASKHSIHDQLAGQLRHAIAEGRLAPGEKLAPARELADGLDVNVHTLLRAFKTLRDEGLLEVRRGRGTTVTGHAPRQAQFVDRARELVAEARQAGLTDQEIRLTVEAQL